MAAAASDQDIDIVVSSRDRRTRELLVLSTSAPISAVKQQWCEKQGVALETITVTSSDGVALPDDATLLAVSGGRVDSGMMRLLVEENLRLAVSVYKSEDPSRTVYASPSTTPLQLMPAVRAQFGISEDRHFRLLMNKRVLDDDKPLGSQNVSSDAAVQIDLAFDADLVDSWSSASFRKHRVYSSDRTSALTGEEGGDSVISGAAKMDADSEVADYLRTAHAPSLRLSLVEQPPELSLVLEESRKIITCSESCFEEHLVWPATTVAKILGDYDGPTEAMVGGRLVAKSETFSALGTVADSLVVLDPLHISVQLTSGQVASAYLPRESAVFDLRLEAQRMEGNSDFELWYKEQVLIDDDALLDSLLIKSGDCVTAVPRSKKVLINVGGSVEEFVTRERSATFAQLVSFLQSRKALSDHCDATRFVFKCEGCSRSLFVEEADCQAVPAPCCRVKSMRLRLCWKDRQRDAESQTEDPSVNSKTAKLHAKKASSTQTQTLPEKSESEVAMRPRSSRHSTESKADSQIGRYAVLEEERSDSPGPTEEDLVEMSFCFENYTSHINSACDIRRVTFRLPQNPKARDLRAAIAEEYSCDPSSFRFEGYRKKMETGYILVDTISSHDKRYAADIKMRRVAWQRIGGIPYPSRYEDDMDLIMVGNLVTYLFIFDN